MTKKDFQRAAGMRQMLPGKGVAYSKDQVVEMFVDFFTSEVSNFDKARFREATASKLKASKTPPKPPTWHARILKGDET